MSGDAETDWLPLGPPDTFEEYMEGLPAAPGVPSCINEIADDSPPFVMRNVASYYEAKGERWARHLASKLRASANDNAPMRRKAVA